MLDQNIIYGSAAIVCAFLFSCLLTPAVRALAFRIGAVDTPKDDRRMHKKPIPLAGGLAVYISFSVTTLLFSEFTRELYAIWSGGTILIILGVLDDIYDLNPWIKLLGQTVAAACAISAGVIVREVYVFSHYIALGWFAYPLTALWIVVLVNAFNLIDGLDGLSSGVCAISCVSLGLVAMLYGNGTFALLAGVLLGACLGFLPYNFYPAKIFIGDTGAYFLGFVLAVISVGGVFKITAVISLLLPVIIFAFPLFDTVLAFSRRVINRQPPFRGDKKHLHHRLISHGLSQRQAVLVLYVVSALFGLIAVIFTDRIILGERLVKAFVMLAAVTAVCAVDYYLLTKNKLSALRTDSSGEDKDENKTEDDERNEAKCSNS